uniref:Uncharacterized protein n=1 Tax=Ditylum brightwellii TaxID=49249 RepID=A0A7S4VVF0_9STRA
MTRLDNCFSCCLYVDCSQIETISSSTIKKLSRRQHFLSPHKKMLFYVRVITLSFLLSPSLAGSFAPHRFLQDRPDFMLGPDDCGTCEETIEYVDDFCCGMDNIGDCFDAINCVASVCIGNFTGDDNFENIDIVHEFDEIRDGNVGNEDYGDEDYGDYYYDDNYYDDLFEPFQGLSVCEDFDCDECGAFTDQVIEECCPFVINDGADLDFENPDIGTCLNTLTAFQISCLFSGCVDENDLPWTQEDNPCESSPTVSPIPTASPTLSPVPTSSSAPTLDCTCCDCTHSSGCNPGKRLCVQSLFKK